MAFFAVTYPDSFATAGTLLNMSRVAAILLVVAVGQSFALIVGGFDISVGSNMGLVSIVISLFMVSGGSVPEAVLIGVALGAGIGLINGLLIAKVGVTPFVTTLGMLTFLKGLADELGNGGSIIGLPAALSFFGRGNWGPIPSAAAIAGVFFVLAWCILERTRIGLYWFAIGGSRDTARIAGLAVQRYEVLAYTLCGLFAGVAGVMLTARVSIGQASLGRGFDLLSIATAVIGGVAIGGGVGRLSGVLAGVALLTVLTTGLDIAGVNSFYQQMATGLVLVGAVIVARLRGIGRRALACVAVLGLGVASLGTAVRADAATAGASDPEHLPMPCDVRLTMADLSAIKAPHANKEYRIEASVPSLANPYIIAFLYGAFQAAKEAGVKLSVDSGEGFMDPAAQIRQLENALSRRVDALLMNPADSDALVASIDEVVDRGIPVFDVGTLSNSTKSYKVVQDDYEQGRTAAQLMAQFEPNGGTGIVQGGPANASWARRRVNGFSDGIKAFPSLKIATVTREDINPTEGLTKFANATQAHRQVDWIYSVFNLLLPPSSIPPDFKSAIYVGGAYDAVMDRALKDGTAKAALPDLPVAVGYISLSYAVRRLNGENVPRRSCVPSPAVTVANMNDPLWARFNTAPPGWRVPSR